MVITFHPNATSEQLHAVEAKLRDLGFQVVRAPSTEVVVLAAVGDGALPPLDEVRVMAAIFHSNPETACFHRRLRLDGKPTKLA